MMNSSLDIALYQRRISQFFGRYYSIIYFVLLAVVLASAIVMVLTIINQSGQTDSSSATTVSGSFDEQTARKLNQLNPSGASQPLPLPSGRINPFDE